MGLINSSTTTDNSQLVVVKKSHILLKLLAVIVIISILATLIIVLFINFQQKTRDSQRKSDLAALKNALTSYKNETPGSIYYPSCPGNLETTCMITASSNFNTAPKPITPLYIETIPQDPQSSGTQNYTYDPGGDCLSGVGSLCTGFTLYVRLENTKDPDAIASQTKCGITDPVAGRYMVCND